MASDTSETKASSHVHTPLKVLPHGVAEPIVPKTPAVDPATLKHKDLVRGPFWQKIPAYSAIDEKTFLDHTWQAKHSITKVSKLLETVQGLASSAFMTDAEEGFKHAPMSVRVSPYMLSLIDWSDPYSDPIRTQFLPLGS